MCSPAKQVERCQCCTRGVTLADAEGTADFLGNDDTAEVVNASYDACCFHIYSLLLNVELRCYYLQAEVDYTDELFFLAAMGIRCGREAREKMLSAVASELVRDIMNRNRKNPKGADKHERYPGFFDK